MTKNQYRLINFDWSMMYHFFPWDNETINLKQDPNWYWLVELNTLIIIERHLSKTTSLRKCKTTVYTLVTYNVIIWAWNMGVSWYHFRESDTEHSFHIFTEVRAQVDHFSDNLKFQFLCSLEYLFVRCLLHSSVFFLKIKKHNDSAKKQC